MLQFHAPPNFVYAFDLACHFKSIDRLHWKSKGIYSKCVIHHRHRVGYHNCYHWSGQTVLRNGICVWSLHPLYDVLCMQCLCWENHNLWIFGFFSVTMCYLCNCFLCLMVTFAEKAAQFKYVDCSYFLLSNRMENYSNVDLFKNLKSIINFSTYNNTRSLGQIWPELRCFFFAVQPSKSAKYGV